MSDAVRLTLSSVMFVVGAALVVTGWVVRYRSNKERRDRRRG